MSERSLHYWDITGVISPTKAGDGPGVYRGYTREDIVCVSVIKHMRDTGVSLQKIREHARDIRHVVRRALEDGVSPLVLTQKRNPLIVVRDAGEPKQARMLVDALRGRQLVLALNLKPIAAAVDASLAKRAARG